MKYKLKYWTFGDYECEEMEDYLNNMAAKGYKLRTISKYNSNAIITGWATFEKTEKAKRYHYNVDIVEEKDKEDYMQICSDTGWTEVAWSGDNICIFSTTSQTAKPLYADRASRFERCVEYNLEKYGSINPFLYIGLVVLGIAAMTGVAFWFATGWARDVLWYVFILATWMMVPLKRAMSLIIIGFAERKKQDGPSVSFRPLSNFFAVVMPILYVLAMFSIGAFNTVEKGMNWQWIGTVVATLGIMFGGNALGGYYNKPWIDFAALGIALVVMIISTAFMF